MTTDRANLQATTRFSGRASDYARYRPDYPPAVLDILREHAGLRPGITIADIGSGTGIFSRLLLQAGCRVIGIEPNEAMRRVQEELLGANPNFESRAGTAESTGLASESVDMITAAQAFHWFDPAPTRREFDRILSPGGCIVLSWNSRQDSQSPFLGEYEALLRRWCPDYARIDHREVEGDGVPEFLGPDMKFFEMPNHQHLDWGGLRGRLISCSYVPMPGEPSHGELFEDMRRLFDRCAVGDRVQMTYRTTLYIGPPKP